MEGQESNYVACKECGKMLYKCNIYGHIKAVHRGIKVKCDKCDYQCTTKANLKKHEQIKHSNTPPSFECNVCGYKTVHKKNLTQHMNTHTEEKFECSLCNSKLNSKDGLRLHMKSVHEKV